MTHNYINGDITTDAEFDTALGQLLLNATRNDVDPRTSWVYRNGQTAPDWEVMILELTNKNDTG